MILKFKEIILLNILYNTTIKCETHEILDAPVIKIDIMRKKNRNMCINNMFKILNTKYIQIFKK